MSGVVNSVSRILFQQVLMLSFFVLFLFRGHTQWCSGLLPVSASGVSLGGVATGAGDLIWASCGQDKNATHYDMSMPFIVCKWETWPPKVDAFGHLQIEDWG